MSFKPRFQPVARRDSAADSSARDEEYMRRCLQLARQAEGRTSPNPIVGAVVLDENGEVVGEGFHERAGQAHAEKIALRVAGSRARGGTLYTNLEPCKHVHNRRTSPCTPLVLEAGIARLVIGQSDPIAAHGGGAKWLEKRGVSVTRHVLEGQCKEANRGFMMWAQKGRPLFILKVACTLDGKIATRTGESKWITGEEARAHGRQLRSRLDAIVVGVDTVLADDPRLTARGRGMRDPLRIVLDSSLRTPANAKLLPNASRSNAPTLIVTVRGASKAKEQSLVAAGAEVLRLPSVKGRPCLDSLGQALAARGVTSALIEGGAQVHASFLAAGLCDELRMYMAPKAFGGAGKAWLGGKGVAELVDSYRLQWHGQPIFLGNDLLLTARPPS